MIFVYWISLGIVSAVFLFLSLIMRKAIRIQMEQSRKLGDHRYFREELLKWEFVVLLDCKTIRSLKMFANRTRLVCAQEKFNKGVNERVARTQIARLVGFSALVNLGELNRSRVFKNKEEFDQFKHQMAEGLMRGQIVQELDGRTADRIRTFCYKVELKHWEEFVKMARYIRFPYEESENT